MLESEPVLVRLRESSYERARSDIFHNPNLLLAPGFLETIEHLDRYSELKAEVLVRWVMNGAERAAMRDRLRASRTRHHPSQFWFDSAYWVAEKLVDTGLVCATGRMADGYDNHMFSEAAYAALRDQHRRDLACGIIAYLIGARNRLASKIPATRLKRQRSKRSREMGW